MPLERSGQRIDRLQTAVIYRLAAFAELQHLYDFRPTFGLVAEPGRIQIMQCHVTTLLFFTVACHTMLGEKGLTPFG